MLLNEYQDLARQTAVYPPEFRVLYPVLGLCGEAGEVAEKIKKCIRDGRPQDADAWLDNIRKEIGDVLWYVANLSADLNLNLEDVATANLDKLRSRAERGVLQGSGDER